MGIDAIVYCDCFEKGRLREPPPFPETVSVSGEGRPEIYSEDLKEQMGFDQWEVRQPCQHEGFKLVHHRIGNIVGVSRLRSALESVAERYGKLFPIVADKVLYSGTHSGDMLHQEDVASLQEELNKLHDLIEAEPDEEFDTLRDFINGMTEVVEASLAVNKPIVF